MDPDKLQSQSPKTPPQLVRQVRKPGSPGKRRTSGKHGTPPNKSSTRQAHTGLTPALQGMGVQSRAQRCPVAKRSLGLGPSERSQAGGKEITCERIGMSNFFVDKRLTERRFSLRSSLIPPNYLLLQSDNPGLQFCAAAIAYWQQYVRKPISSIKFFVALPEPEEADLGVSPIGVSSQQSIGKLVYSLFITSTELSGMCEALVTIPEIKFVLAVKLQTVVQFCIEGLQIEDDETFLTKLQLIEPQRQILWILEAISMNKLGQDWFSVLNGYYLKSEYLNHIAELFNESKLLAAPPSSFYGYENITEKLGALHKDCKDFNMLVTDFNRLCFRNLETRKEGETDEDLTLRVLAQINNDMQRQGIFSATVGESGNLLLTDKGQASEFFKSPECSCIPSDILQALKLFCAGNYTLHPANLFASRIFEIIPVLTKNNFFASRNDGIQGKVDAVSSFWDIPCNPIIFMEDDCSYKLYRRWCFSGLQSMEGDKKNIDLQCLGAVSINKSSKVISMEILDIVFRDIDNTVQPFPLLGQLFAGSLDQECLIKKKVAHERFLSVKTQPKEASFLLSIQDKIQGTSRKSYAKYW